MYKRMLMMRKNPQVVKSQDKLTLLKLNPANALFFFPSQGNQLNRLDYASSYNKFDKIWLN